MPSDSQTGFFISFEGSEGCGKSTQILLLAEKLRRAGLDPLVVREPGGTVLGEEIRHLLKHSPPSMAMTPEAELLLFAASRVQLVRQTIQPALAAGRVVLSDRYADSTTVYQGVGRKIAAETVAEINRFATGGCLPDVTFLLDMDAEEALTRARRRRSETAQPDRMEQEPLAFYEAVRQGYLAIGQAEPRRLCVLDAQRPQDTIAEEIGQHLKKHVIFQRISF